MKLREVIDEIPQFGRWAEVLNEIRKLPTGKILPIEFDSNEQALQCVTSLSSHAKTKYYSGPKFTLKRTHNVVYLTITKAIRSDL
jgi:hypothetical protein